MIHEMNLEIVEKLYASEYEYTLCNVNSLALMKKRQVASCYNFRLRDQFVESVVVCAIPSFESGALPCQWEDV